MVGISPRVVCRGQYWLVYQLVLSAKEIMGSNGWYIALICLSRTIMVGISLCLFFHGQKWIVYLPVLSAVAISVGISSGFVCLGQ